jgi:hypothetical protein
MTITQIAWRQFFGASGGEGKVGGLVCVAARDDL